MCFHYGAEKKSLRIFLRREKFEKKSTFRGLGLKKIARYIQYSLVGPTVNNGNFL